MESAEKSPDFRIELPSNTPEFMRGAYFSCLHWAIGFDPILEQFKSETGNSLPTQRSGIAMLVDKATGFNPGMEFIRAFVPWFNERVWGDANQTPDEDEN